MSYKYGNYNILFSDDTNSADNDLYISVITLPSIKRVIFNPPATIVFWEDGTKTVVKTSPHDKYDKEKGILWAFYIKFNNASKSSLQKKMRNLVEGFE